MVFFIRLNGQGGPYRLDILNALQDLSDRAIRLKEAIDRLREAIDKEQKEQQMKAIKPKASAAKSGH